MSSPRGVLPTRLADAKLCRKNGGDLEGDSDSMPARHSINKDRERPAGTELEEVVECLGVVAPGVG